MKNVILFVFMAMITVGTLLVFSIIKVFSNINNDIINKVMSIEVSLLFILGCYTIIKLLNKLK